MTRWTTIKKRVSLIPGHVTIKWLSTSWVGDFFRTDKPSWYITHPNINPSDRVMVARFQARPFNMSVVQVYAPTSDGTDEQVEQFYADLETTLDDNRRRIS